MTQEEIDNMIEDWVKHGLPHNLKRLISSEEQEFEEVEEPHCER